MRGRDIERAVGADETLRKVPGFQVPDVRNRVEGVVLAELPQLVFRVDVGKGREVLAHAVGMKERNFVRLIPGDKVEIELAAQDQTRGRILKKL